MLGKLQEQGQTTLIFSPITKTSNSGMFSNRRLALLLLKQASIGYLSKVPDQIESFTDASCWNRCKQTIDMTKAKGFLFNLKSQDRSVLVLRWQQEKQKQWQFKFDNELIAAQWYQQIYEVLYPRQAQLTQQKSTQKVNLDYTKLQNPSRFNDNFQNIIEPISHEQPNSEPQNQAASHNSQRFTGDSKAYEGKYRFRQFQKANPTQQISATLPIITTFRQKLTNHSRFNNLSNHYQQAPESINWNSRWYQIIQNNQPQQQIIQLYNQFQHTCQKTCLKIIEELTFFKNQRTLAPKIITMNQEMYVIQAVTYRLLLQRDVDGYLCQDRDQQQQIVRQELQNFKFIMRATRNKGRIKIPMVCIVEYVGFIFFCEAEVPKNYQQVDQHSIHLLSTEIANLQGQLRLKLNLSSINLYTASPIIITAQNMIDTSSIIIIIRGLKQLVPCCRRKSEDIIYWLPTSTFLQSSQVIEISKHSTFQERQIQYCIDKFLKSQFGCQGSIISPRQLKQKLYKCQIPPAFLDEIISKSNSLYLKKIMTSQLVADILKCLIRKQINKLLNLWKLHMSQLYSQPTPNYKSHIIQIISQFFSSNNQLAVWHKISQHFNQKYPRLLLKKEDLVIGYLLQSIFDGVGVQFDYQVFRGLKHRLFIQQDVIPSSCISQWITVIGEYSKQDMCLNYDQISLRVINQTTQNYQFKDIVAFYELEISKPVMQKPKWLQLCRFMSYFIPYRQQEGYHHLDIYSCLDLQYLNNSVFCILLSAVKWLLLINKVEEVLQLIDVFNSVSWFWLSQTNPFMIKFYQLMVEYNQTNGQVQKAIDNCNCCLRIFSQLYTEQPYLQSLDVNYKLAKLYMLNHRHRQALDKYLIVKHVIKAYSPESPIMLDLLCQVTKLYLHLGDIDSSVRYCRQTIDYSLLSPFKNQEEEFQIYFILIRAFQIKDQKDKFKYYVDIIEDKFGRSKNCYLVKETLKLTFQQYLQNATGYYLKKMAYLIYSLQQNMQSEAQYNQSFPISTVIQQMQINNNPCTILRAQLDDIMDITDWLGYVQRQKQKKHQTQQPKYYAKQIMPFCIIVGFQFILGLITENLTKLCC